MLTLRLFQFYFNAISITHAGTPKKKSLGCCSRVYLYTRGTIEIKQIVETVDGRDNKSISSAFFLFLAICSMGCCCSKWLYKAQEEKSRQTFIGYFRKFGSFGGKADGSLPTGLAEVGEETEGSDEAEGSREAEGSQAASRRKSSNWSISTQQSSAGGLGRTRSTRRQSTDIGRTLKFPALFGLNLRNERRMKECEPEFEDGGDDGSNMRFLSSMLRQHHNRTNNIFAPSLFPMPVSNPQPPARPTNNRSKLSNLSRLVSSRRSRNAEQLSTIREQSSKAGSDECNV